MTSQAVCSANKSQQEARLSLWVQSVRVAAYRQNKWQQCVASQALLFMKVFIASCKDLHGFLTDSGLIIPTSYKHTWSVCCDQVKP